MNLLKLIVDYARTDPDRLAFSCRERQTGYRKLGSRIERATARLQGEWNVRPGETVAYTGRGHQDAIVLLLALVQSGASLLTAQEDHPMLPMLLKEYGVRTLLNDAGVRSASLIHASSIRIEALHAIIAERCAHPATPLAGGERQSRLIRVPRTDVALRPEAEAGAPGQMTDAEPVAVIDATVLFAEACTRVVANVSIPDGGPDWGEDVKQVQEVPAGQLFDESMLGPIVLATLAEGRTLRML